MSEAVAHLDFDSWLASEHAAQRRHELVNGRAYLMAGGTERHGIAAGLLYELVAPVARRTGCRPFTSNRVLRVPAGNAYYPDLMVICTPAPHRLHEDDATLIVEILSPSTADTDRREKATGYASLPSIETLLLVDPDARRVEAARIVEGRVAGWDTYCAGDIVPTRFGDIDVDALHDQIDATATT